MRNSSIIIFTIVLLSTFGCASKKMAKKADKFAQAGMYQDAAMMYYRSVVANSNNIEAKSGLQRNGQLLLQEKLDLFKTHYDNHATKDAVYAYLDANKYFETVKATGVILIFPPENKVYYEEVKEKYLEARYAEGLQALDVDEFNGAEIILSEILSIESSYKDSKAHWVTAKYEPIYRRAKAEFENRLFRTSYYSFNEIIKGTGTYKDALQIKANSLDSATITIAIAPFYSYNLYNNTSTPLQNQIIKDLNQIKSPFYTVVADPIISSLPENGRKSRIIEIIPIITYQKNKIAAKAVLTGSMSKLSENTGDLIETTKKGYVKSTVEYIDEVTKEKKTKAVYDKVTYKEYTQVNKSTIAFEYSLIDVKKSTILLSDVFNITKTAEVHYARYSGDLKSLVPGHWEKIDEKSSADAVWDNSESINKLKALMKNTNEIKGVGTLTQEAYNEISASLVNKIEKYNPEK